MMHPDQIEELICLISSLDRPTLIHQLLEFQADFPVDFSGKFLDGQTVERLRHLLFALCVQSRQMPDFSMEAHA